MSWKPNYLLNTNLPPIPPSVFHNDVLEQKFNLDFWFPVAGKNHFIPSINWVNWYSCRSQTMPDYNHCYEWIFCGVETVVFSIYYRQVQFLGSVLGDCTWTRLNCVLASSTRAGDKGLILTLRKLLRVRHVFLFFAAKIVLPRFDSPYFLLYYQLICANF